MKGVSQEEKVTISERVKSAVTVLATLPSTRFAVLEYFASVYDDALFNYISLGVCVVLTAAV